MRKRRLTLVDHSYHRQTASSDFFREMVAQEFEVTTIWDESWRNPDMPISPEIINATNPDAVIFFQLLPRPKRLARVRCRNLTWVPMHDSISLAPEAWRKFRGAGLKVLCFSASDATMFEQLGMDTLAVQYFPPALMQAQSEIDALQVFFWPRRPDIGWTILKRLLGPARPDRTVLRSAPDPDCEVDLPSAQDQREFNIEICEGWLDHERYLALLEQCSVFMAPRALEGIGRAMLEAMARGCAIIAPDSATMNEYLRHGMTGYLYNPAAPSPLDLSDRKAVGRRAQEHCADGHRRWRAQIPYVLEFVKRPATSARSSLWSLRYGWR